ncbi:hypothetical protein RCOM_0346450 [Ricinus communis]|uniref:Uncharacterized protein n=1 Tax=Ricinus communis TaxID=3988 RepID=B9SW40_RICCO|nr:hypothetical protein RCOM_0346450 [Ricinus communis]
MSSVSCFLKNPFSWMSSFLGYGSSSILFTSVLLALATLFFKFSKKKPRGQVEKLLEDDFILTPDQEISPQPKDNIISKPPVQVLEDEYITDEKEARENDEEEEDRSQIESECLGRSSTTSEDSEVNYWQFQDHMLQSPDFSDGSISDEDSLIEIALPSGHYIGHKETEEDQDLKSSSQKKLQDFVPGSFFKQHGLMELLAELNDMNIEEENLIEIDISMGSIKCPRFEIEA